MPTKTHTITVRRVQELIETLGRPRIDLKMFNVQKACLTFPGGKQIVVTPDDECFAHVVRLAR